MHIEFRPAIDPPWIQMEPVRLGPVPPSLPTADQFVTVEGEDGPLLRLDLYSSGEPFCFEEAVCWSGWVVVGWGQHVHLVELASRRAISRDLGSYFGHLYPGEDHLLVASAERLFCFAPEGSLRWTSDILGIDGVLVHEVVEERIEGTGEWDPPGGWRSFRLNRATGQPLSGRQVTL